jgi:hypothetical protein
MMSTSTSNANTNQKRRPPVAGDNTRSNSKLSTIGFRVNDETKAMLQDYANRLSHQLSSYNNYTNTYRIKFG